jgi:putative oxidoreductase
MGYTLYVINCENSWWLGEYAEGIMEYSCALIWGLIVIAASKDEKLALKTN